MPKSADVISVDRVVDADLDIREFDHRPARVRKWFSNNVFQPVFSYLVGWTGSKAVMLRATTTGILKTASVGAGLERIEVDTGTAVAAESADIDLANTASRIRVIANDFDMYFRSSRDGTNFEDQIHIIADTEQTFDIVCASYRVQRYGLNDVEYEVEAYR